MSSESYAAGDDVTRDEALDLLQTLKADVADLKYERAQDRKRLTQLEDENEDLRDTVDALQSRVDVLEGDASSTGKETKVRLLVRHAENLTENGQRGVVLTARDIKGATGVTRRYAYDLIDDLPDEYHFLRDRRDITQYGDLEIDKDAQTRGLFVDCEQLHNDPEAVNKFTTRPGGQEGSR